MIIFEQVRECDFTERSYDKLVPGAAYLSQGATGRWCQVMHAGPEYVAGLIEEGVEILTHEEAVAAIEKMEGVNSIDF